MTIRIRQIIETRSKLQVDVHIISLTIRDKLYRLKERTELLNILGYLKIFVKNKKKKTTNYANF